jgi:pimeloyl-ACP methyl ester carboxylesterase
LGPAIILVNGAIAYRAFDRSMAHLAKLLGKRFTVYNYDRRGRGESSDKEPFAKAREMEDLQALVEDAGGAAMVFGISSGAVVSLDAAASPQVSPKSRCMSRRSLSMTAASPCPPTTRSTSRGFRPRASATKLSPTF